MNKAYTYQLFFNLERPNMYKEGKNPWQLAKEKNPSLVKEALMLPPIDLDMIVKNPTLWGEGRCLDQSLYTLSLLLTT